MLIKNLIEFCLPEKGGYDLTLQSRAGVFVGKRLEFDHRGWPILCQGGKGWWPRAAVECSQRALWAKRHCRLDKGNAPVADFVSRWQGVVADSGRRRLSEGTLGGEALPP